MVLSAVMGYREGNDEGVGAVGFGGCRGSGVGDWAPTRECIPDLGWSLSESGFSGLIGIVGMAGGRLLSVGRVFSRGMGGRAAGRQAHGMRSRYWVHHSFGVGKVWW